MRAWGVTCVCVGGGKQRGLCGYVCVCEGGVGGGGEGVYGCEFGCEEIG